MEKNEGYKRWIKELTDDGRLSQLQRKTPEELSKEYGLPTDFFRKEKKRLVNRPHEQSFNRIKTLKATPKKRVILNKADVCTPKQAFTEIIDNIFDNFDEENRKNLNINISIFQYEGADEIIIKENSGGIKEEKQEPLVRLGDPSHLSEYSIGTWGEGFKIAAAALGRDIKVFTHYPGESPVLIHIDSYWWQNEDWEVPVYPAEPETIPEGTTITIISKLRIKPRELSGEELAQYLGEVYGHKLLNYENEGKSVTITISAEEGHEISVIPKTIISDEDIKNKFAFPPYFSPIKVRYHWVKGGRELDALFIIGLTPHHSAETSGVTMFGNGRLFAKAIADKTVGYGDDKRSKLPAQHPSVQRLHIMIFFESKDPYNIPWQAPLKEGYNENNIFSTEIISAINDLAPRYVLFARYAKEHDIVPFSKEWETLSDDEKLEMLFPNLDDDERAKKLKDDRVQALLKYKPKYEIREYEADDIDFSTDPFDISHARQLQKLIKSRNNPESKVNDEDFLKVMFPEIFTEKSSKNNNVIKTMPERVDVKRKEAITVTESESGDSPPKEENAKDEESGETDINSLRFKNLGKILERKDEKPDVKVSIRVLKDDLMELKRIFGDDKSNKELIDKAIKTIIALKGKGDEED